MRDISCLSDPCVPYLISGDFRRCPLYLDCYASIFQPANLNSPFTFYLKGNFREVFYGRDCYSYHCPFAPPFSVIIGPLILTPLILTRDMGLQNRLYFQPPLQLDEVMGHFPGIFLCSVYPSLFPPSLFSRVEKIIGAQEKNHRDYLTSYCNCPGFADKALAPEGTVEEVGGQGGGGE